MNTNIDFLSIAEGDKSFVTEFENFVNGRISNTEKTGMAVTTMHRYLQHQTFRICLSCFKALAHNYQKDRYDQHNEFVSQLADVAYSSLIEDELVFDPITQNSNTDFPKYGRQSVLKELWHDYHRGTIVVLITHW